MRAVPWVLLVASSACSGPPASDAAVCRDVIHRLCLARCATADLLLNLAPTDDCEDVLTARTGCASEDFMFASRANFLSCRAPIIRGSDDVEATPECNDVDDMFRGCPSMATFFKGGP